MKKEIRHNTGSGKFASKAEVEANPDGTVTQIYDDYWKRRCAAAERLLDSPGDIADENFEAYKNWRAIVNERGEVEE